MNRMLVVLGAAAFGLILGGALVAASGRAVAPGAPGRVEVPAPIDAAEIQVRESSPPQYAVRIQAGLPSGCAERGRHDVRRDGDVVTVTVLNTMPRGDPICTMIYGTYELNVGLGDGFVRGTTYTVRVNDRSVTFTAQ